MELLLTNRPIDAPQALAWGMVTEVVAVDQVSARAMELAQRWPGFPVRPSPAVRLASGSSSGHPSERREGSIRDVSLLFA